MGHNSFSKKDIKNYDYFCISYLKQVKQDSVTSFFIVFTSSLYKTKQNISAQIMVFHE